MTLMVTLTPEKETRLQEQARQAGLPLEQYVQQALDRLAAPAPSPNGPEADEAEQVRLQAIMAELQAEARALVPDRGTVSSNPVVEAVADKFRRQGFNL